MKQLLIGHTSPETAYLQEDYPYSFNLRCQRKVWVETKKGYGQRFVTQTSNPKKPGHWNKPKPGGYHTLVVMYLDTESNHVEYAALTGYDSEEKLEKFAAEYAPALKGKYERGALEFLRAAQRVAKKVTWEVRTAKPGEEIPDVKDQTREYNQLILDEMKKNG